MRHKHPFCKMLLSMAITVTVLLSSLPLSLSPAVSIYGDVDGDGKLASSDVRVILSHLTNNTALTDEQASVADYNEDGDISTADIRAILTAIVTGADDKPYTPPVSDDALLRASAYDGEPYILLNDNEPLFTAEERTQQTAFETYAPLDALGRCGVAYANLCRELMPTEDRGSVSSVTPTGWHNQQYEHVSGGWLYNRCHIIGFQLAGEQANKQNLITGTRYMNIEGMLPFENMVTDYIKETNNHVLYRATPIFVGDNLLAEGVRIEAWSVEDSGEGIAFHVFCYNVQPGVTIDYATGENRADDAPSEDDPPQTVTYILNISSKKFHLPTCKNAASITDQNRAESDAHRDELIAAGYAPCGNCKP